MAKKKATGSEVAALHTLPGTCTAAVGVPFQSYAQAEAINASLLKYLLVSPLAFDHARRNPAPETDAMRLGRAVHTAVLEPARFLADYVLWTGERRAGKEWDQFKEMAGHRTILRECDYAQALELQQAVRAHPVAGALLADRTGRAELSISWQHPRTGVQIKSRLDWLTTTLLVDVKTTRDVSPRRFCTQSAQLGYPLQLALYSDGVAALRLGALPVKLIAVQSSAPHDVVVYDVTEDVLNVGRAQYEAALDLYVECSRIGKWPGQASEAVLLHLPAWALPEAEAEQELTFGGEAIAF